MVRLEPVPGDTLCANAFWRGSVDVINVSGHRLSTAEIESALITHAGVAETAVVGTADELTGQAVYAFVTLKPYVHAPPFVFSSISVLTPRARREFKFDGADEAALIKELTLQVRKVIGPFAAPKRIYLVADLPKTRSGKVRPLCVCGGVPLQGRTDTMHRSCGALCARSLRARLTNSAT